MFAILLTFIIVNSYVLTHGIRTSTVIGTPSLSPILYSRETSGSFSRRLYVVIFVFFFFHAHPTLIPAACTMIVDTGM